ncbi:MAG: IS66 family transposase [Clostridia bacterium]
MSYDEIFKKYEEISKKYEETSKKKEELLVVVENLTLENNMYKKIIFGGKREYTPQADRVECANQFSFFEDIKNEENEDLFDEIKKETENVVVHKNKKNKKKKAGINKSVLKDVLINVVEVKINEEDKCPICNSELKKIGKKIVHTDIQFIPAHFEITHYVQWTAMCSKCGTENSNIEKPTFVKSKLPNPLLSHSFISPSLATEVIYQKYYMGVPLYRQEKTWSDKGLILPRNMMANWIIKLSEYYLTDLYELILKKMKAECDVLHCDETTMQCNKEEGRKAENNSYMWVVRSGELEEHKGVIFKYSSSRSEKVASDLLSGFSKALVTDGYAGYNVLDKTQHAECWAHCRRKFYESIPLNDDKKMDVSCSGYKGLVYCDKLFSIEREIASLSPEEKLAQRLEKSKPILDSFFEWVNFTISQNIITNAKLKKALIYSRNQQKELREFLNNGKIPLSNSLAERAIRPFAVHRKNWLFADSTSGAKANAIMYSLIESAKINNLNIWKYIEYLLKQIPQLDNSSDELALENLLPWSKELPNEILNIPNKNNET